jgi:hypothetical protein
MGDEHIRKLGDFWRQAIGDVIAVLGFLFSYHWLYRHGAAGVLPAGAEPVVDRRRHCPVHRLEGREMFFAAALLFMPRHGARSHPVWS